MIEFKNVVKRFGDRIVLDGVSLAVPQGCVQFVIGASGTGKSVLMKLVVGLLRADGGQILVDGEDVTQFSEREFYAVRRRCGMVFQHSTLFDSMSILENVAMPIRKQRACSHEEAEARANEALALVHMEKYTTRMPPELGAGLQKRVAIARALALGPQHLVYDEPTTGLDPVAARRTDVLIREMAEQTKVTSIVVSHDIRSIFSIADRVAFLFAGKLHFLGTPEELRASQDAVVKQFISGAAEGPMAI